MNVTSCKKERFARSSTRFTSFWRRVLLSFPSEAIATSEKLIPMPKFAGSRSQGSMKQGGNPLSVAHVKDSVACVFLCDTEHGLGQHYFPDDNLQQCLCAQIYGERNYKDLGYLQEVKHICTDDEKSEKEEKEQKQWIVTLFSEKPLTKIGQKLGIYGSRTGSERVGAALGFRSGLTESRQQ